MPRRVQTKRLPPDCVKIPHASYLRLMGLATQSRLDPGDLLSYAIAIFCTATANMDVMHPPKATVKPKPKEQRSVVAGMGSMTRHVVRKLKKNAADAERRDT